MGAKTLMSVEEYLHTTFDGADREYLDGEVVERNMGNKTHGRVQLSIAYRLKQLEATKGFYVVVEVRQQVSSTRYRIPDVAIFPRDPGDEVPSSPPLAAIEVLSPDDRIGYMTDKLEEYIHWGVRHIWLADPERRKFFVYDATGLHEVSELTLPEYSVTLTKSAIFEKE